jgi:hypothetical protein
LFIAPLNRGIIHEGNRYRNQEFAFDATRVDWTFGSDNAELKHWNDPKVQAEFDAQRFGGR